MLHRMTTQIGQTSTDHGAICKQVRDYLLAVNIDPPDAAACPDWDGALLSWVAIKDGIVPPVDSGNPMSWLSWGTPLETPIAGAVAVMTSGSGRHRMTCGVVARTQGLKVYVIGAFESAVQMRAVPVEQVIAARRPPGASPMVQPETSTGTSIVIHNEMPPASYAAAPLQIAAPMTSPPRDQASDAPAVASISTEGLARMLSAVQAEFSRLHHRIDEVSANAIGAVRLEPAKDHT